MSKSISLLDFKTDISTIKRGALSSIVIQLVFKLKGLITMPIMTYYLLPREMGIFNLVMVASWLLTPIFCLNLIDGPVIYFVQEKNRNRIRDMYNVMVNSVMLLFPVFAGLIWILLRRWGGEYNRYLHLIFPVIFAILLFKVFSIALTTFLKTDLLVKYTFYKDLISVVLTIGLVMLGFSYYGMLIPVIITYIGAGLFIYHLIKGELPYRFYFKKDIFLRFLKMSLPLLPVFIFSWVVQSSDSYFLVFFKGEAAVGKYSVIYGLSNVILIFSYALYLFWNPVSAKLWVEDKEKYRKAFVKIFGGACVFLLLAVVLFELNSKLIISILARRPEYRDAYGIMGIIALAFALQVLLTLLTGPLYSNKNPNMIFISYLSGGILNGALNYFLIPKHGIWGAAVATVISYLVIVLVMGFLNYRVAKFPFLDKRLIAVFSGFVVLWGLMGWMREHMRVYELLIVDLLLITVVAGIVYGFLLHRDERMYLSSAIRNFKFNKMFKS